MQVAEKHHSGSIPALAGRWLAPAAVVVLVTIFFWKILFTTEYTWLDSPDLAHQVFPWLQFQAAEWHQGRFPLWAHLEWGGQPLLGQAQPGAAYPLNWLLFLAPLRNGQIQTGYLNVYYAFIHVLGGLFAFALCRGLGRGRTASVLGAVLFAVGGYFATIDWPQMINGAIWAPLVFLACLRIGQGERLLPNAARGGLALGMAWLSGHHQAPIFISLTAGFFLIFLFLRGIFLTGGRPQWNVARAAIVLFVIAGLVGALQTLPALEYGKLAKRWVGVEQPLGWNQKVPYMVHAQYSFWGLSIIGILIPGVVRHASGFLGSTGLALAVLGAAAAWRHQAVRWLAGIAGAGILLALGAQNILHGVLYAFVPMVEKARSPNAAILIFHTAAACLAAWGFDALAEAWDTTWSARVQRALLILGALVVTSLSLAVVIRGAESLPDDRPMLIGAAALTLAALWWGYARGGITRPSLAAGTLVLLMLEMGLGINYYQPSKHNKEFKSFIKPIAATTDLAAFLRTKNDPRVFIHDDTIQFNFGDWYGIDVFGGYLASITSNIVDHEYSEPQTRDLMGVRYYLARQPLRPDQQPVFTGRNGVNIYEEPKAMPRAWAAHSLFALNTRDELKTFMRKRGFDFHHAVYYLGPDLNLESCRDDEVTLETRQSQRVVLRARMNCRGMVILNDIDFPGWQATVGGKPVPIHAAYGLIRGVVAEKGEHRIEFTYRPTRVYLGAALTAIGLAVGLWLGFGRSRVIQLANG
ncbi:MAG: YfhO family protein [Acidobacteria bacterium]|nr:YfhO family protein [Acidobacteriota bacterium]